MELEQVFQTRKRGGHRLDGKGQFAPKSNKTNDYLAIRVTSREKELLKQLSRHKGQSMANFIKTALNTYISTSNIEIHMNEKDSNQYEIEFE